MRRSFFIFIVFANFYAVSGQTFFPKKNYPVTYSSPVKFPVSLAGNFGECRPNHFHSGIDVRTEQVENKPLYAIQEGYVSRVQISHKGFGTCLYISHPEGYTSVYAHLNSYFPALAKWVEKKQYEKEKWDIDLFVPPHLFPVKKGDFIAKSGNTGSSFAPHLHLEIRNTRTGKPLNPLLFYPKQTDGEKPVPRRLALYDGHKSIYEQEPKIFNTVLHQGQYTIQPEIVEVPSSAVFFGIQANDFMENSLRLGVFEMNMYVDAKPYFGWQMDNIGYDETRYMNAIGDYKTKMLEGYWIQLCRQLPMDQLNIYKSYSPLNGVVDLSDEAIHDIKLVIKDVKGNQNIIHFKVRGTKVKKNIPCGQLLKCTEKNKAVGGAVSVSVPKGCLYDHFCFHASTISSSNPYSDIYEVGYAYVPLHDSCLLSIQPKAAIPEPMAGKVFLKYTPFHDEKNSKGIPAKYEDGLVKAYIREFGFFEIFTDQHSPVLTPSVKSGAVLKTGHVIKIGAEDLETSVAFFRVSANGKYLNFKRRKNNYYYTVDTHLAKGEQKLEILARDESGNEKREIIKINRL